MTYLREDAEAERRIENTYTTRPMAEAPSYSRLDGVRQWLSRQRIAEWSSPAGNLVAADMNEIFNLAYLGGLESVRSKLDESGLRGSFLDEGLIRLAGALGRPITQAASRGAYDTWPDISGLAFKSRYDDREQCWAIYDRSDFHAEGESALSSLNADHLSHVRYVAFILGVPLPSEWM